MNRGVEGTYQTWIDNEGLFLLSNSTNFGFGLQSSIKDDTLYSLAIIHMATKKKVWTANRRNPAQYSDEFVFDEQGSVYLKRGRKIIWSLNTGGKAVSAIQLLDSGNLVMLGDDNSTVWESFLHPTRTLLPNQVFSEGMSLSSNPGIDNYRYFLQFKSGDLQLFINFEMPQTYWNLGRDRRTVINKNGGSISKAVIDGNSWKFYDKNKFLLQFIISDDNTINSTWIAVLGSDGTIEFTDLGRNFASSENIPSESCATPYHCGAYYSCSSESSISCECPSGLVSRSCKTGIVSPCDKGSSNAPTEMLSAGDNLTYFALDYVSPTSSTDLNGCKASCAGNCSCLAVFYSNDTRHCYQFDSVGSFKVDNSSNYAAYVKVSNLSITSRKKHAFVIAGVAIGSLVLIVVSMLIFGGRWYCLKKMAIKKGNAEYSDEGSDEESFLETLSGMPVRYTYRDLEAATNSFAVKLGQGGFGSVYQGLLPDGKQIAVKKLEGVGQGKKEFRAEVTTIGSIHHVHLVRLKGFCAEGSHRLLVYEFMEKGSLDKWIFKKDGADGFVLDWDTRLSIAVGVAKGLAYLHEECDVKIIHCDIKPENVLLHDHFQVKVSDFGLAKLMSREESHVFTSPRGTLGYLAPEQMKRIGISAKTDVYSYGMVLLEIIGGRKNYDLKQPSEKFNFPAFVFKKMEDKDLSEVLDSSLEYSSDNESIYRAVNVALLCIQEDMSLRPPMTEVVQMLQGLSSIPQLPTSLMTDSCLAQYNSNTYPSDVGLSGPR